MENKVQKTRKLQYKYVIFRQHNPVYDMLARGRANYFT